MICVSSPASRPLPTAPLPFLCLSSFFLFPRLLTRLRRAAAAAAADRPTPDCQVWVAQFYLHRNIGLCCVLSFYKAKAQNPNHLGLPVSAVSMEDT